LNRRRILRGFRDTQGLDTPEPSLPRAWTIAGCCASLGAWLVCGSAGAESLVSLRDPGRESLGPVVYPALGMPALVVPGDRFSVLVAASCVPDLGSLEARLSLVGVPEHLVELTVLGLDPLRDGTRRLHLRVPAGVGADHWDLVLDDDGCLERRQPSSVRTHRVGERLRFAVLADEQVGDPTGLLPGGTQNGTLYPKRGTAELAARRRLQVQRELELLDPLFVLYPGDLVFGMDYQAEYREVGVRLGTARLAVFAVPGNHDGYALHRVAPRAGWHRQVHKAAFCVGRFAPGSPVDGVAAVGGCVLARLSDVLELQLEVDGLDTWRRVLGPDSYAFEVGGLRFVGLNTYGGSVARRAAVPVSLGRLKDWVELDLLGEAGLDPLLGAPLVDNYGGFLTPDDIGWLGARADEARADGLGLVVFGHHDPTGVYLGQPGVIPNDPFGEDPVGMGDFEVWNFDGGWDSQPGDGIETESAAAHSGARLVAALPPGPVTMVVGHAHYDSDRSLPAGQLPGQRADLTVLQATTGGAGLAHDGAYRGYRLVEIDDGTLGDGSFAEARGWPSVPLGNLWSQTLPREAGPPDRELVSGLPMPMDVRLRFELPRSPTGYRFTVDGQDGALSAGSFSHGDHELVAWLPVEIPAARPAGVVADEPAELARVVVRWELAEDNAVPEAVISRAGRRPASLERPLRIRAGAELRLSALGSRDEAELVAAHWSIGGLEREGFEPRLSVERPGSYPVTLTVVDACGAEGRTTAELRVRPRLWPRRRRAPDPAG